MVIDRLSFLEGAWRMLEQILGIGRAWPNTLCGACLGCGWNLSELCLNLAWPSIELNLNVAWISHEHTKLYLNYT